jgi:glutathione-regulated potassium-efflux system ancillary protein KefC
MLLQSAIFLAAAVVAVPVFKRLGLGSVLGYLAAGALIGPSGLGFVHEVESTMHFAEFGVVLLLFLIGLELQPSLLWKMRGQVFGLGGVQVFGSTLLFALGGLAFGLAPATAIVAGFGLSLSSTAFVIQLLNEKNELTTPHGRLSFSILLFQDLAAIPALALVPLLGPERAAVGPVQSPLVQIGLIAAVIVGLVLAGRFLLRPLFRFVASTRSHELSAAWALLVVIGTALVMTQVGLSMALGAFLAGVLLADSEYRHEIEADIEPFKGLLLGLFFMAVGMSANLHLMLERPALVVGLALGILVVKLLVLYALGVVARLPRASSASLGVALSQGGEFAFVIYGVALEASVLTREIAAVLVVAVTLSMGLTPLAFLARDRILAYLAARKGVREFDQIDAPETEVIIAGFGRFAQIIGRILRAKRIRYTALEASAAHIDFMRRFGTEIYYGDASRVDLLRAAKADKAKIFVLAIDDPDASVRAAKTVKHHFPHLKIIARARNRQHAMALMELGVEHIIRELFHSSLVAARELLEELGLSPAEAHMAVRVFREQDEAVLQRQLTLQGDEAAMRETALKVAADLEKLFERDQER